jgi:hypothetical protein
MPAAEKSAKERAEEFHQRQRAWKACRCKECRRFYAEVEALEKTRAWEVQYTATGFRASYGPQQPPIDDNTIVRATLGSFRDV